MDPGPTTTLGGRFELRDELGRGGMGVVYRAREVETGRDVALKLLGARSTPTQLERFKREAELTASLSHPGIVRVHSAGALDGIAFIAYELLEGCTTLGDLLERRALDLEARVRLIVDIASAVGFAHARGVLHRDLKPANVLVDATGRARVADFGVATAVGLERLTMTGAIVGTPMFMAPEQITGGVATPATDVWALGVMLYVALAGVAPFESESLAELSARICGQHPAPPRAHAPDVSAALEAVCLRALSAASTARYTDATAFALDLERARAARPRRRGPQLAAVSAVVVASGAGLAFAWASRGEPAPATVATLPAPPASGRGAPAVVTPAESPFSTWAFTKLAPTHREVVIRRARSESLVEVERALADLERDPDEATLPALRCAAWLREARDDLAPVDERNGRRVFERWIAEARRAEPAAARELGAVNAAYWSADANTVPELAALHRFAEAIGAALLLARWSPYDVDEALVEPLLGFATLTGSETSQAIRVRLRDALAAQPPTEPLLVTAWAQLCNRRDDGKAPAGLDAACWKAHARLVAVMPAGPPARCWGRVQDALVLGLRWRSDAALAFTLTEAERAQAGSKVLWLAAEGKCTEARRLWHERGREVALDCLQSAWAFMQRVPHDQQEEREHLALRDLVQALALECVPRWFDAIPKAERPPALLPPGLRWGERPGTCVQASDGASLEWADGSFRVAR